MLSQQSGLQAGAGPGEEPAILVSSAICIVELSCVIQCRVREKALTNWQGQELCDLFRSHLEERVSTMARPSDRLLWDVSEPLKAC
jgi:hypothetical protein